eukprot:TRINITY_DN71160_c0_g1_i1.p1 TRINITY_DN71160_c0_g1~~TRINITY_DN71160_c0_g1_i1.p1  ORF type:complete len:374 (+),score=59.62 TRINITY_DN71160_c0_g1_i1:20-1141(+)
MQCSAAVAVLAANKPANFEIEKTVDVSWQRVCDTDVVKLAKALERNTTVTSLNLSHNNITYESAPAISKAIAANATLLQLDLASNPIGDIGAQVLALQGLQFNITLHTVILSHIGLSDNALLILAKLLGTAACAVQRLVLSFNDFSTPGVERLLEALGKNTTLTELDLAQNSIQSGVSLTLGTMLQQNSTLRVLNLSRNDLGPPCVGPLATGLGGNQSLQLLDLQDNELGIHAVHLLEAIQSNKTVTLLLDDCPEEPKFSELLNKRKEKYTQPEKSAETQSVLPPRTDTEESEEASVVDYGDLLCCVMSGRSARIVRTNGDLLHFQHAVWEKFGVDLEMSFVLEGDEVVLDIDSWPLLLQLPGKRRVICKPSM